MANAYNRGKQWLQENDLLAVSVTGDIFMLLVDASYVYDSDTHLDYGDVTGEIVTGGYTAGGIALANLSIAIDNPSNESRVSADRADYGALTAGVTVHAGIVFENIGAGAPAGGDILIGFVELPNTGTNGQNFAVDFSGTDPGIFLTYAD